MTFRLSLFLVACFLCVSTGGAMAADKVGFVDMKAIWKEWPAAQRHDTKMKELSQKREKGMQQMEALLRQQVQTYQKDAPGLSPQDRAKREEALQRQSMELQQQQAKASHEIETAAKKGRGELVTKLRATVASVAKSGGYARVFSEELLIYSQPQDNITPTVLTHLKKNHP